MNEDQGSEEYVKHDMQSVIIVLLEGRIFYQIC